MTLNQHYFNEVGRLDTLISISGKNSYFKTSKCPKFRIQLVFDDFLDRLMDVLDKNCEETRFWDVLLLGKCPFGQFEIFEKATLE